MRHHLHRTEEGSSGRVQNALYSVHGLILNETAVTSIEYALLASLIAMVVLVSIVALGSEVGTMWQGVADKVIDAMG